MHLSCTAMSYVLSVYNNVSQLFTAVNGVSICFPGTMTRLCITCSSGELSLYNNSLEVGENGDGWWVAVGSEAGSNPAVAICCHMYSASPFLTSQATELLIPTRCIRSRNRRVQGGEQNRCRQTDSTRNTAVQPWADSFHREMSTELAASRLRIQQRGGR